MNRIWREVSLAAAGLLVAAVRSAEAAPALPAGSLYDQELRWTDDSGTRVELSAFRGRPVVLTMFYTSCSSVCSITLEKLREIERSFREREITADFVLISYDSRLDTPRELARFRASHELPAERWHLLAGSAQSVKRFATRIGVGNYDDLGGHIAHSFRILVLDEDGVARQQLDPGHARVASLFEPVRATRRP